jgi:hypothetical protein
MDSALQGILEQLNELIACQDKTGQTIFKKN